MRILGILSAGLPALVLTVSSCSMGLMDTWSAGDRESQLEKQESTVRLTVNASGVSSRASASAFESTTINSLQVFVYYGGHLEAFKRANGSSVSLECYAGESVIAAVANFREITAAEADTSDDLSQIVSEFDDNENACVMFGVSTVNLSDYTGSESVTIPVARLAAKICLERIQNYTGEIIGGNRDQNSGHAITIDSIYLINVAADAELGGATDNQTALASDWLNKNYNSETKSGAYYIGGINYTIKVDGIYNQKCTLYCYPNPSYVALDSSGSSKYNNYPTRLVIQTTENDEVRYYSVMFSDIKSNYIYDITELKLSSGGSSDPTLGTGSFNTASVSTKSVGGNVVEMEIEI